MSRRRRASPVPRSFLRRRSTKWLVAATLTLAVGITLGAIAGRGGGGGATTATPTLARTASATPITLRATEPSLALPDLHPDPSHLERADVVRIIDGDTIDVRISGRDERVRYYGVDTTERGQACFSEATRRNQELAGQSVLLLPDARERDRYGRLLRYAFDGQSRSIEGQLIAEGLGHAWQQDGSYRDQLVALEGQAHAAGVGCLWK